MRVIFTILLFFFYFNSIVIAQAPFVTIWQSDAAELSSTNDQITFPGIGNYNIAWEMVGNPGINGTLSGTGTTTVIFPYPGTYRLSVTGGLEQFRLQNINFTDRQEIMSIEAWGDIAWTSMTEAFKGAVNLTYAATDAPDLSNVTSLSSMFYDCPLFNGNLNNWNTSTITNMSRMFYEAESFNGNISLWDVSSVNNMSYMFYKAYAFNQAISFWDVSNVLDMSYMFASYAVIYPMAFNQYIGGWNVSNVTDFTSMFHFCIDYNQDMSNWNVSNATSLNCMFYSAHSFNQDINSWNVSNTTDFGYMFYDAEVFNQPLDQWNTINALDMYYMFGHTDFFNQDIGSWNVSSVQDMTGMFFFSDRFNQSLNSWNVSNVMDMNKMFRNAQTFNQPLASWNVSNVTDMSEMFRDADFFNQDIGSWDVSSVTDMEFMFSLASAFNMDIGNWNVSNVTNMRYMFEFAYNFDQDISNWNVSNVTNMERMFYGADIFNQPIGSWDVSSVITMSQMFRFADLFNQDLSNWNTPSLTDIESMFYYADNFNQSLGNWDISNVTVIGNVFSNTSMSVSNYDNTLIGWASQNVQPNISVSASGVDYCNGEAARQSLIDNHGWNFYSDTKLCPPMVTTWQTDNTGTSGNNQILIPATGSSYNIIYSKIGSPWISGTSNGNGPGPTTLTLPSAGTYEISISGDFQALDFFNNSGDRLKILSIEEWGATAWSSFFAAFYRCENLNITATDAPNFMGVTSLFGMFEECTSLNADLSHWDVSTITNMSRMFKNASSFNQDLGNWNVSNVTNMSSMLDQTSLSLENYDNTIIGWSSQPVQPNITLGSSGLEYCEAKPERQAMINTSNWTFSGDTYACPFTDIYVDHTATGTNDGTSWTNAFTDLQSALALGQDHHIHIAKGTYKPTSGLVRGIAFEIGHRVHLYGGYPNGGGTRNVSTNLTNLSGEIDDIAGFTGNSYHVVKVADVFDVVLDGIIVRDGAAIDPASFGRARGGGLYLKNTTITLNDVEVKWNKAIYGAGLFATLSPEVRIINSEFKKNTADYGSALYHSNETNMFIEHSKIVDNTSLNRCAIEINNSLYTKIENSIIADNASTNANAIAFIATNRDQSCDITNTTIVGESKNKNLITIQIGYNDQMDLTMNNSIVAHQTASFDKNVKAFNNGVLNFNHNHCYFQGTTVIGNGTNTLFSDMDGGLQLNSDYSVADCSPVVDAGNNSLGVGATDYFGNPRYYNTIDIGAYEAQAVCKTFAKENTREEEGSFSIYPNPTSGKIFIQTTLENPSIIITNMLGRELIFTQEMEVDLSHLSKGLYWVRVFENGSLHGVQKMIKN